MMLHLNRFSLLSYLSSFLFIVAFNLIVATVAQWHWTHDGIQPIKDSSSQETSVEIDWTRYPSTFDTIDIATPPIANHYKRRTQHKNQSSNSGSSKETVMVRYWSPRNDSFKLLDVPVYRSDSIGNVAERAAEMTDGEIPTEIAG